MAANNGNSEEDLESVMPDGHGEIEGFSQYYSNNSSETLSEGTSQEVREKSRTVERPGSFWPSMAPATTTPGTTSMPAMVPVPTVMEPVTVPNVPGLTVNIVPGVEGAKIDIHGLNRNSGSSAEATDESPLRPKMGGSLFLGHVASYPSVKRLSHFIEDSLPLGSLIVQSSRSVAGFTGRRLLRPFDASPSSSESPKPGADHRSDSTLRRLLHFLDATAAETLTSIDHIVLLLREASGKVHRWLISSTKQLRDLANYLNKTYDQEADKWVGASDIIVFCGGVSFAITVGAFDALIYVADWVFDGRAAREFEKREKQETEV